MIETGESEMIFQKAILEQGRGYVLDTLAEIRERRDAGAARLATLPQRRHARPACCPGLLRGVRCSAMPGSVPHRVPRHPRRGTPPPPPPA